MPLTKRQSEILTYLQTHIHGQGYAPSFEEIAEQFGFQSLATVHEHLTNLEKKGYIRRSYNESRSIEVLPPRGTIIEEIGYHCRDYFLAQPERFSRYPGGVLAHSTHVKGLGRYDAATGIETPRVQVTLATALSAERCRRINLGYRDPATIDVAAWSGREREGILVVPRAGEMLYRLRRR
jgi:hypothetical protein